MARTSSTEPDVDTTWTPRGDELGGRLGVRPRHREHDDASRDVRTRPTDGGREPSGATARPPRHCRSRRPWQVRSVIAPGGRWVANRRAAVACRHVRGPAARRRPQPRPRVRTAPDAAASRSDRSKRARASGSRWSQHHPRRPRQGADWSIDDRANDDHRRHAPGPPSPLRSAPCSGRRWPCRRSTVSSGRHRGSWPSIRSRCTRGRTRCTTAVRASRDSRRTGIPTAACSRSGPTCTSPASARAPTRLCLPVPPAALVDDLIGLTVAANDSVAPAPPGSLYLRPTMLGTDVTIGAAASPSATAMLYVLACPVGDYLPPRPLTVAVETAMPRTTRSSAGSRPAPTTPWRCRRSWRPVSAGMPTRSCSRPGGASRRPARRTSCWSTASTCSRRRCRTPSSTVSLATRCCASHATSDGGSRSASHGRRVPRVDRPSGGRAPLTGTAAVVATVGALVVDGISHAVGTAGQAPQTSQLRAALVDIRRAGPRSTGRSLRSLQNRPDRADFDGTERAGEPVSRARIRVSVDLYY